MAERRIQIVLKRLTAEDLRSYGINIEHAAVKTMHENHKNGRKRKYTEIEACDFIGKNTRSKARTKIAGTKNDAISISTPASAPAQCSKKDTAAKHKSNDDFQKRKKNIKQSKDNVPHDKSNEMSHQKQKNSNQSNNAMGDFIANSKRNKTRVKANTNNDAISISTSAPAKCNKKDTTTKIQSDTNTSSGQKRKRESEKRTRKTTKLQLQEQIDNDSPSRQCLVNEIVLTTITGFAPWPSRILKIIDQTILIEFFGTGQRYVQRIHSHEVKFVCKFYVKFYYIFWKFYVEFSSVLARFL